MLRRRPRELDVVAVGNALVDLLARAGDETVATLGLAKGAMTLATSAQVDNAAGILRPETRVSGGSAANTAVGLASLGARAAFIGRVDRDELGSHFTEDINNAGVYFAHHAPDRGPEETRGTGHCFIIVTPDAERTMATYLGVAGQLGIEDIDPALVSSARITYLEGYLWDVPDTRDALRHAASLSHQAGHLVALSLSDPFVVERHRADLQELIDAHRDSEGEGAYVDIVFGNEQEVTLLYESSDFHEGARAIAATGVLAALTRGASGSVVLRGEETVAMPAVIHAGVVDTTGAGDLYAAGFLAGLTLGRSESGPALLGAADLRRCAALGGLAASEIISHLGSRPVVSLAHLAAREGVLAG